MSVPPTIFSPLTDFNYMVAPPYRQFPHTSLCGRLEMKFMDCLEAYGFGSARSKCAHLLYDMFECRKGTFQVNRARAIRKERMKQYREGKLKVPFDEYPPLDSYLFV